MASVNQVVDYDTAAIVAHDLGFEPQEAAIPEVAAGRAGKALCPPHRGR